MAETVGTVVVGAGISGLTAAFGLARAGEDVLLVEAGPRVGGAISTLRVDGFLVECGPNSVRMTDELEALATEAGVADELVFADARSPRYIFHAGRLVAVPAGLGPFLRTPLLSRRAKLRLLAEPLARARRDGSEESIAEFVTRRLGREVHDVLVAAFVSGVYAGDTRRLSADAVFTRLVELEREHGSIVRGALASALRKRDPSKPVPKRRRRLTLTSLRGGLSRLPEAIAEGLGDRVRLSTPVERVDRADGRHAAGFAVHIPGDTLACERLVLATPAYVAAGLLGGLAPRLSELLAGIHYPPLASVSLAYERDCVDHPLEGFGFLAPRVSGMRTLGAIFASSLFEDRAPEGWVALTCFVGGATDPGAVELDDEALVALVAADLERALGARSAPRVLAVTRWARAIPQYEIGHRARVAEAEGEASRAGVRLLGNYLHGVSVGECVAAAVSEPAPRPADAPPSPEG